MTSKANGATMMEVGVVSAGHCPTGSARGYEKCLDLVKSSGRLLENRHADTTGNMEGDPAYGAIPDSPSRIA